VICAGCGAPVHLRHTRYLECEYCARSYVNPHWEAQPALHPAHNVPYLCSTHTQWHIMSTNCQPLP